MIRPILHSDNILIALLLIMWLEYMPWLTNQNHSGGLK